MPGLTNYVRSNALNVLMGTSFSAVSALHVNLFTENPSTDGTSGGTTDETEWSCPRIEIAQSVQASDPYFVEEDDGLTYAGGRRLRLINEVTWSTATTTTYLAGGDETVIGGGIYTASTGGILLAWGPLGANATVSAGDVYTFATGKLLLSIRKLLSA